MEDGGHLAHMESVFVRTKGATDHENENVTALFLPITMQNVLVVNINLYSVVPTRVVNYYI